MFGTCHGEIGRAAVIYLDFEVSSDILKEKLMKASVTL